MFVVRRVVGISRSPPPPPRCPGHGPWATGLGGKTPRQPASASEARGRVSEKFFSVLQSPRVGGEAVIVWARRRASWSHARRLRGRTSGEEPGRRVGAA